jgi:hypothetical protein
LEGSRAAISSYQRYLVSPEAFGKRNAPLYSLTLRASPTTIGHWREQQFETKEKKARRIASAVSVIQILIGQRVLEIGN